jgi:uncharacterized membrane protein
MKSPTPKTLKDIGIYFLMLIVIIFLLALLTYLWDHLAANDEEDHKESLSFYFAYFLLLRFIFIMPVVWFFVEQFNGKYKENTMLKIVAIITLALLVALIAQGDVSGNINTEYKRFFTYPLAGLIAFFIYSRLFYRGGVTNLNKNTVC